MYKFSSKSYTLLKSSYTLLSLKKEYEQSIKENELLSNFKPRSLEAIVDHLNRILQKKYNLTGSESLLTEEFEDYLKTYEITWEEFLNLKISGMEENKKYQLSFNELEYKINSASKKRKGSPGFGEPEGKDVKSSRTDLMLPQPQSNTTDLEAFDFSIIENLDGSFPELPFDTTHLGEFAFNDMMRDLDENPSAPQVSTIYLERSNFNDGSFSELLFDTTHLEEFEFSTFAESLGGNPSAHQFDETHTRNTTQTGSSTNSEEDRNKAAAEIGNEKIFSDDQKKEVLGYIVSLLNECCEEKGEYKLFFRFYGILLDKEFQKNTSDILTEEKKNILTVFEKNIDNTRGIFLLLSLSWDFLRLLIPSNKSKARSKLYSIKQTLMKGVDANRFTIDLYVFLENLQILMKDIENKNIKKVIDVLHARFSQINEEFEEIKGDIRELILKIRNVFCDKIYDGKGKKYKYKTVHEKKLYIENVFSNKKDLEQFKNLCTNIGYNINPSDDKLEDIIDKFNNYLKGPEPEFSKRLQPLVDELEGLFISKMQFISNICFTDISRSAHAQSAEATRASLDTGQFLEKLSQGTGSFSESISQTCSSREASHPPINIIKPVQDPHEGLQATFEDKDNTAEENLFTMK